MVEKKVLSVCIVSPLPPPYGGIAHWTATALRYAAKREDVVLNVIDTAPRWRACYDMRTWKRVVGGGIQFLGVISRLAFVLITRLPHVVHITTSGELGVLRDIGVIVLARLARVPVVYHIHFGRIAAIAAGNTREWRLISRAMRMAQTVVPIDARTEDAIREYLPAVRQNRIPNWFVPDELPPPINHNIGVRTVIYVGWQIPTKGISELIEAWSRLDTTGWQLRLVGPCDAAFRKRLMQEYHPDAVEFVGELDHDAAMKAMGATDIVVLPSYAEGFPNVLIEAMALKKAIIATRVGAIPEMLADGRGILIAPRNADDLGKALSRLMHHEELRSAIASRARTYAMEHYAIHTVFAQLMTVWRCAARRDA